MITIRDVSRMPRKSSHDRNAATNLYSYVYRSYTTLVKLLVKRANPTMGGILTFPSSSPPLSLSFSRFSSTPFRVLRPCVYLYRKIYNDYAWNGIESKRLFEAELEICSARHDQKFNIFSPFYACGRCTSKSISTKSFRTFCTHAN